MYHFIKKNAHFSSWKDKCKPGRVDFQSQARGEPYILISTGRISNVQSKMNKVLVSILLEVL